MKSSFFASLAGYLQQICKRAGTRDLLIVTHRTWYQSVGIIEPVALPVLQEPAVTVVTRIVIMEMAVLLIPAINGIGAVHIQMTLRDGEEQEPVEVVQLLRHGAALDVGIFQ